MTLKPNDRDKRSKPSADTTVDFPAPTSQPTAEAPTGLATSSSASQVSAESSAQVDQWFDRQLVNLYGEVVDEPVPEELLAVINRIKSPH